MISEPLFHDSSSFDVFGTQYGVPTGTAKGYPHLMRLARTKFDWLGSFLKESARSSSSLMTGLIQNAIGVVESAPGLPFVCFSALAGIICSGAVLNKTRPHEVEEFVDDDCTICQEPMRSGAWTLSCGHSFHLECLQRIDLIRHSLPMMADVDGLEVILGVRDHAAECPLCRVVYRSAPGVYPVTVQDRKDALALSPPVRPPNLVGGPYRGARPSNEGFIANIEGIQQTDNMLAREHSILLWNRYVVTRVALVGLSLDRGMVGDENKSFILGLYADMGARVSVHLPPAIVNDLKTFWLRNPLTHTAYGVSSVRCRELMRNVSCSAEQKFRIERYAPIVAYFEMKGESMRRDDYYLRGVYRERVTVAVVSGVFCTLTLIMGKWGLNYATRAREVQPKGDAYSVLVRPHG